MRIAFIALLTVHGLIHLLGFAKAFRLAEVARLRQSISRPMGTLWLLSGIAFLSSAALLVIASRYWCLAAAPALVFSQLLIVMSWREAKFGTVANLIVLVPFVLSALELRSSSFRSIYERERDRGLARHGSTPLVTEADLSRLPQLVQTYLRRVGVVGRPRVNNFRARWASAQIRSKPNGAWMDAHVEQDSFFDEPTRLFLMQASLYGLPFEAWHRYVGPSATMQVRVASIIDVVDARGPEMNQSETVTLFNDMCLLAPATLVDANVLWLEIDGHTVRGTFTNAGNTISAELSFDQDDLVNFVSNDRYLSADGKTYERFPWSTPVGDYRDFAGQRLAARGEAVWKQPQGDFVYGRFELEEIRYNVGQPSAGPYPVSFGAQNVR